jgi:hypothetical protein
MDRLSKHFKTYKDEHNSDPLLKIFKLVDCSPAKEKTASVTRDSKNITGVNYLPVL